MAQTSPDAYVDAGEPRPLICLANSGNRRGAKNSSRGNISCSAEYIRHAATIAEEVFAGITLIEPQPGPQPSLVSINDPFPGGYILKEYAKERDQRGYPPGMMIEFNRGLYVGNQGAHTPISQPNEQRIADLRERTYIWLERLVGKA